MPASDRIWRAWYSWIFMMGGSVLPTRRDANARAFPQTTPVDATRAWGKFDQVSSIGPATSSRAAESATARRAVCRRRAHNARLTGAIREEFADQGYVGPLPILTPRQCRRFLAAARQAWRTPPLDWSKGQAVTSRAFYEIAAHPAILDVVVALLGEDVMLWGAASESRRGQSSPLAFRYRIVSPPGEDGIGLDQHRAHQPRLGLDDHSAFASTGA